jgi:hypothetical protein
VLLLIVIVTILRYVTETALIAGVDEIEGTGAGLTVRRGFRLGWSRQAWRLFLTEFVIYLLFGLGAILLLALAASPLLLLFLHVDAVSAIAIGATFLIVAGLTLSLVMPYIQRQVVLGRQGVAASFRQGLGLVRASLRDTGLMWLILAAIGFVWGIVKIPVIILLVVLAVITGGIPAWLAYTVSQSWVAAVAIGVPLFLLVLVPTVAFIEGLFQVYNSSAWTLAYRDVTGRHSHLLSASAG